MSPTRRIGAADSATRHALLDAAQALILEAGYASVTSRRVAAKAGLKPQLVHYYFRTMDDLFIALVHRGAEQNLERQGRALESSTPLRALWEFCSDPAGARLTMEFSALANHRKAIRSEIAAYAEQFRKLQTESLAVIIKRAGVPATDLPPGALAVVLTAISQIVVIEAALGVTSGHQEIKALVASYINRYEPIP
jgi:AcrR family transcriptional regulator